MGPQPEKMISREVAEQDVIALAERLASLYQHFAQVLLTELGEEQTREIIEKVIKNYGEESGRNAKQAVSKMGLESAQIIFPKVQIFLPWAGKQRKNNIPMAGKIPKLPSVPWPGTGLTGILQNWGGFIVMLIRPNILLLILN